MAAKIFLRCFSSPLLPWTLAATSRQNSVLRPHVTPARCLTVCGVLRRKEPTNGNLSDEPDGDSPVKQIRKRRPVIESDSEEEGRYVLVEFNHQSYFRYIIFFIACGWDVL